MDFPENCKIIRDRDGLQKYESDESWLRGHAQCVLIPEDAEAVGKAVGWAAAQNFDLVVRGGGTGMVGAAVPQNSAVISLERLQAIHVDSDNMWAHAQAGAITGQIDEAAADHGLWFPVDPSSLESCTIGGNFATNAGGPRAIRFGVTSRWVLKTSGFLSDGRPVTFGSLACKDVAGYALRDLLCGSEGTLAVITDLWLRLIGRPRQFASLLLFVDSSEVNHLMHEALRHWPQFSALEYFDPLCTALLAKEAGLPKPDPNSSAFLLEQVGTEEFVLQDLAHFVSSVAPDAVTVAGFDAASHRKIWQARRGMSKAMYCYGKNKFNEDISLPAMGFSPFLITIRQLEAESGLQIPVFGHAGDGNLHVNIMHADADREKAQRLVEKVFVRAMELGGSISGEHGIGLTKKPWLEKQAGRTELALMRGIRKVFDPASTLARGKIFDE